MPLGKKTEAQKSTQTSTTPGASVPADQQRPRRIQP